MFEIPAGGESNKIKGETKQPGDPLVTLASVAAKRGDKTVTTISAAEGRCAAPHATPSFLPFFYHAPHSPSHF